MESKKNIINVYTTSSGAELSISAPNTKQVISATNNRAQYFAEQAKKFRDETKLLCDNAKMFLEQNSDVTYEYINELEARIKRQIATKQPVGDYALREELPTKNSELVNDSEFVNNTELSEAIDSVSLPEREGHAGSFLMTDGEKEYWTGVNSFQLFDTKLLDYELSQDESKGWALQGTYVYKEALAGTRYGYPDFYNKCLEEYNEAVQDIETWTQPVLTANGTLGGATYACISSSSEGSSYYAYRAFDGDSSTRWSPSSRTLPQYLDFYTPEAIVPSSVYIDFYASNEAYSAGIIQGSNNGESWDDLGSFTGNASQTVNVELVAEKAYKYIRFFPTELPVTSGTYGKVAEIKISATIRHPYKKYSNGHLFYDIADKEAIDTIFDKTGSAWMYGIDTENERVFLPRDRYFALTGGVMGNGMTLGLVNSATNFVGLGLSNNTGVNSYTGNYGVPIGTSNTGSTGDSVKQGSAGITTDPEKSGIILEPDLSKYLYICVGNTTNYEGITEVVGQGMEILEQVNQGINQGLESRVMLDGSNAEFPHIIETYQNGTSWYRIWSDGWCEQGGSSNSNATTTLLKTYKDTSFTVLANPSVNGQYYGYFSAYATSVNTFYVREYGHTGTINWHTCGYLA